MKLRTKLVIIYLSAIIIPLGFVFILNYENTKQSLINIQRSALEEIADLRVLTIERYFDSFRKDINIVREYYNIRHNLPILEHFADKTGNAQYIAAEKQLDEQLSAWLLTRNDVIDILLFDSTGRFIYSANPDHAKLHQYQFLEDYYKAAEAVGKDGIFVSKIFTGHTGINREGFLVSASVRDFNNNFAGVVIMETDAEEIFSRIEDRHGLGDTGETLIARYEQTGGGEKEILFLNRLRYNSSPTLLPYAVKVGGAVALPIQAALRGEESSGISIDYRNIKVLAVWRHIADYNLGLVAKIDMNEILYPVHYLRYIFLLATLVSFLIGILLAWSFGHRITEPIISMFRAAKNIEEGKLNKLSLESLPTRGRDEMGLLSAAFWQMAASIKSARANLEKQVQERTADLEKFRLAVENASDQIIITDNEGIVLYANRAIEMITGYAREEVIGTKAGVLWGKLMPKKIYADIWKRIKTDKKNYEGEITNRRKSGEEYTAVISINPILDRRGNIKFFVGLERDITREKRIDRARTEFVSLASHQLRTPLTGIKWYTEALLSGDAGKLKPEQKRYLEEVYHNNERLIELVNFLLDVSKIEMGVFATKPEFTDLKKIANNVLDVSRPEIAEKKLDIIEDYGRLTNIKIDPKIARIIIQNLLSNAVKYTPPKGKINIFIGNKKSEIILKITDTGYGIPQKDRGKIFTRFFRADNIRDKEPEGTGLGLYITKAAVENAGGKIWFESQEGKGTTFYVTLPAVYKK